MKGHFLSIGLIFILVFSLLGASSRAGADYAPDIGSVVVPGIVSYQGQLSVGGSPYTGTGYFKFAIVNQAGNITYWSNDGTSTVGNQPVQAVQLQVANGQFNVLLGDTGQSTLTAAAFSGTGRYLRVWFGANTSTFTQLTPDHAIAAVPYALQAQEAANAANLNNKAASFYLNAGNIAAGTLNTDRYSAYADLTTEGYLDNSATGDLLTQAQGDGRYVNEGQANSITAGMIGNGTITLANLGQNGCADGQTIKWNGSAWVCSSANDSRPAILGGMTFVVDANGHVGDYSSIAIGVDGMGLISYFDTVDGHLHVNHCNNLLCSVKTSTTADSLEDVGDFNSITIGADGLGLISYYDSRNGALKVLHCGNLYCNAGNTITIGDYGGDLGAYTSITIGADNTGLISYYDVGSKALKVLHCGNYACDSGNTYTSVDTNGIVGVDTSITMGADGLGLISYYDQTNKNLKVLHCGNLTCDSDNTFSSVDTTGDVGLGSSITVGSDGLGLISYYDYTNSHPKVAHCGNLLCNSGNTITTPDTWYDAEGPTSIIIGPDGLGLISYHDITYTNLRLLHCNNLLCTHVNFADIWTAEDDGYHPSIAIGSDGAALVVYLDRTNHNLVVTKLLQFGRR